jgi:predicted CxxxxCH...CXXCH cytochrome family protein
VLHTVATGIPSSSRRWFANSQFDHAPHRNMTCVSCHSKAGESALTSDVLSPNLTWTDDQKHSASCTDCHHEPSAQSRGARADCQACHLYHDRTQEGPPAAVASLADVVGWANGKGTPRNAAQSAKPPPAATAAPAPDGSPPAQ